MCRQNALHTRSRMCLETKLSDKFTVCRYPGCFINSLAYDRGGYQKGLCARVKGSEMHKTQTQIQAQKSGTEARDILSIEDRIFLIYFYCHFSTFIADFKSADFMI